MGRFLLWHITYGTSFSSLSDITPTMVKVDRCLLFLYGKTWGRILQGNLITSSLVHWLEIFNPITWWSFHNIGSIRSSPNEFTMYEVPRSLYSDLIIIGIMSSFVITSKTIIGMWPLVMEFKSPCSIKGMLIGSTCLTYLEKSWTWDLQDLSWIIAYFKSKLNGI